MTTVGQRGEDAALRYLLQQGYTLMDRNWRCRFGELDLVMQGDDLLVFVEVKARTSSTLEAAMGLTSTKISRLTTTIYHYLDIHNLPADAWRLDLVAVALPASGDAIVEHLENCLDW